MMNVEIDAKDLARAFTAAGLDYQTFFLYLVTRQGDEFPWEAYMNQLVSNAKTKNRLPDIVRCAKTLITEAEKLK